jgi:hypothetical protein
MTSLPESVCARFTFLTMSSGSSARRGHLRLGVLEVHDARARLRDHGLRLHEHLAVRRVEPARDLARQLEVLALVLADRHLVGLVEQDVGRL